MANRFIAFVAVAAAGLSATGVAVATERTMQGPPDTVFLTPSSMPGYARTQADCTSCHSAEYMQYQPPNAPRAYWDTMVHRMKAVFHAPVDDADMPAIVDYLSATYGNKQSK
jgi:sulfite dehydrogenase (cytochrome) subunit B